MDEQQQAEATVAEIARRLPPYDILAMCEHRLQTESMEDLETILYNAPASETLPEPKDKMTRRIFIALNWRWN